MKKYSKLFLILLLFFFSLWLNQFPQTDSDTFLKEASVDFAVPDAPAFKILQTEPSSILRPTSVREVGVTIGDLFKSGKIPDNYALEISPGLLFSNSLSAYQKNPFLYRARISFATKSLENSAKQVGAGLRFTLWDETDLRTDKTLEKILIDIGHRSNDLKEECITELQNSGIDPFRNDFEDLVNECLEKKNFDSINDTINTLRENAKKKKWNAVIVEAGFALSAFSNDSLPKHLGVNDYQWWFSGAFPLGKGGQILVGLNGGVSKNEEGKLKNALSNLGIRGYYGDNRQKVFVEGNVRTSTDLLPSISGNIGYEYNLINGLWVDLALGLIKKDGSKFVSNSSLNIRFATPE